jgi:ClpP class serine protease
VTPSQHFTFEVLNDRYKKDAVALNSAVVPPEVRDSKEYRRTLQQEQRVKETLQKTKEREAKREVKKRKRQGLEPLPLYPAPRTVIVVSMASENDLESIHDVVSFLIRVVRDDVQKARLGLVEIVLQLESPGGAVSEMGYASNQVKRLREEFPLIHNVTVCVDTVAASGGYMMASQASRGGIIAAPFAVVGSIGVYSKALNYRQFLEKWGIHAYLTKSGNYKANLDGMSEVTEEEIAHEQHKVDAFKEGFEQWIVEGRGSGPDSMLNISAVAIGEVWLGRDALEQ